MEGGSDAREVDLRSAVLAALQSIAQHPEWDADR
jgi:hypothetical protein